MSNYVPNYEELHYQVHPSQLRWAMSQLGAVPGYNVLGYAPGQGGMYIIVVQVPVGTPQADWRAPVQQRRHWPRWRIDGWQVLSWLCALVIIGGLGYLGYTMATGGSLPTWEGIAANMPAMPEQVARIFEPPAPHGEPVVEKTGWHWPWESAVISKPAPRDNSFRWPWDDAAKQVSDTVDMAKNVTLAVVVFLLLGVALWFVAKVRGALGK